MDINQLATTNNLKLAWRRITTGGNYYYKNFFRKLYYAYEVALDENLNDLRGRILGGAFIPKSPERIYLPKKSGLHRPISLLHIEDQIVLQAFANLAAKKIHHKRKKYYFKTVFSNILQRDDSIFFFKRWQDTYQLFQSKIEKQYTVGYKWIADFDLAAFYDTISHELLIKTLYPKTQLNNDLRWLLRCLCTWSAEKVSAQHNHGLPQGPIASDFLAECFLFPIDRELSSKAGYLRYVDDIRLSGKSENSVREAVINLEKRCRDRGLIPQSGKFTIKRAQSAHEAMGLLPSIADPHRLDGSRDISSSYANRLFLSALGGKPKRIVDKTRIRFVLYRASASSYLLKHVLKLIPHHPEHADVFFEYLARFGFRKPTYRLCLDIVKNSPYPFVRGEAWHVLARYLRESIKIPSAVCRKLIQKAILIAKDKRSESFSEKWGACHFLAVAEKASGIKYTRFLKYQPPLFQALLADVLPDSSFQSKELAETYLKRTDFEPGLSICGKLHSLGLSHRNFNIQEDNLPSQVRNTLCQLGVIQTTGGAVDPIAEILHGRYNTSLQKSWINFLGVEYIHSLALLKEAEAAFHLGPSQWLACQNSFNHSIFIALQKYFHITQNQSACTMIDRNGCLVDFGPMLDRKNSFSRLNTVIADCFREINTRRNRLPVSHPYEKKTAARCKYLSSHERNYYVSKLITGYSEFVKLIP